MTAESRFASGIFYEHGDGKSGVQLLQQSSQIVVRLIKDGTCIKERAFSRPFWQSERLAADFAAFMKPLKIKTSSLEKDIIKGYESYLEWRDRPKDPEPEEAAEGEIYTSCIAKEALWEEVVIKDRPYFMTLNEDRPTVLSSVYVDGIPHYPILDDAVRQGAVLLPTGFENYGTVEDLLKDLHEHIHTYLDVSDDLLTFAGYYVLLSWVYDQLDTLPYLRALGDTGTGKSRFLRVIGGLCYKPIFVAGAITPAPIYRMIRRWGGTIVLDEADFRESSEKNEVITILNCGFSRGTPVIRCEKDNPDNIQILPTFCPKVIATRFTFADKALESRCLTEIMKQTTRREIPRLLPRGFYEAEAVLRNKLLKFRFDRYNAVDTSKIHEIDLGNIEPRLAQATLSFAVLFYNMPETFDRFKTFLKNYQVELIEERASSLEGQIVGIILELLEGGNKEISSQTIADRLNQTLPKAKYSAQRVGKHLKSLGLHTEKHRLGGNRFARLIVLDSAQLQQLRERYDAATEDVATPNTTKNNENKPEQICSHVSSVSRVWDSDGISSLCDNRSHREEAPAEPHINDTLDYTAQGWSPCPSCSAPAKYRSDTGCLRCGYHDGESVYDHALRVFDGCVGAEDVADSAALHDALTAAGLADPEELIAYLLKTNRLFEPRPGVLKRV